MQQLWFSLKFAKRCSDPLFWYIIVIPESLGFSWFDLFHWDNLVERHLIGTIKMNLEWMHQWIQDFLQKCLLFSCFWDLLPWCILAYQKSLKEQMWIENQSMFPKHQSWAISVFALGCFKLYTILHSWELTAQAPEHRLKPQKETRLPIDFRGCFFAGCSACHVLWGMWRLFESYVWSTWFRGWHVTWQKSMYKDTRDISTKSTLTKDKAMGDCIYVCFIDFLFYGTELCLS